MSFPETMITVWSSKGIRSATSASLRMLAETRPQGVMLQTIARSLRDYAPRCAAQVRQILPDVRVWLGVSADYERRFIRDGSMTVDEIHQLRLSVGQVANDVGAEGVCWNAEAAWKVDKHGERLPGFHPEDAQRLVREFRDEFPHLKQMQSAYDRPMSHKRYAWRGWDGVDAYNPQIYWALDGARSDGRREFRRHRLALRSHELAVQRGILPPNPVLYPYLQAHDCTVMELCHVADQFDGCIFWAAPTRCDQDGMRAVWFLSKLRMAGFRGPGRVFEFQRAMGLKVDGHVGPKTLAAAAAL